MLNLRRAAAVTLVTILAPITGFAEPEKIGELKALIYENDSAGLASLWEIGQRIAEENDPIHIPYLIGLIDADNSYGTIYGIGYFGLGRMTDVPYSAFHDGPWWRNWWEKNRAQYGDEVAAIEIPEYEKTAHGKRYTPRVIDLESLEGRLEGLRKAVFEEGGFTKKDVSDLVELIDVEDEPTAIPSLIGLIDADNTDETIYGIGYHALHLLGTPEVWYSILHDGPWWRNWWEKNKDRFGDEVASIPIPDYGKTESGKVYVSPDVNIDSVEGQLEALRMAVYEEGRLTRDHIRDIAGLIEFEADMQEFSADDAIPTLIGILASDNSPDAISAIGSVLRSLTDVGGTKYHDGGWWTTWWEENGARFTDGAEPPSIPEFPRTTHYQPSHGKDLNDPEQLIEIMERDIRQGGLDGGLRMMEIAPMLVQTGEPEAIAAVVGVMVAHNDYSSLYGMGYFGFRELMDWNSAPQDAEAWSAWWQENRSAFPGGENVELPDYTALIAEGERAIAAKKQQRLDEEFEGIPSETITIAGHDEAQYVLIGPRDSATAPERGWKVLVVMPGGDGDADFTPFVRRIHMRALPADFIVLQPLAFKWRKEQRIIWPTEVNPAAAQGFSTEQFVEWAIEDAAARLPIDREHVYQFAWSSGGPAAYALSLKPGTPVRGTFVAGSVFRDPWNPPYDAAKGHRYYLLQGKADTVTPIEHAERAEMVLQEHGADVEFVASDAGHGWQGDVFEQIRAGMAWLQQPNPAPDPPPAGNTTP